MHVFGTFEKGGEVRALSGETSKRVRVRRGKVEYVGFELAPSSAEYRLALYDGDQPVQAEVWLDADEAHKVVADRHGRVQLAVSMGPHELVVRSANMLVRKDIHAADTDIHNLTINLERERRFQAVAGGIELDDLGGQMEVERIEQTKPRVAAAAAPAPLAATAAAVGGSQAPGAPVSPAPHDGIARYRRDRELGRGAMGVVYEAFDLVLERPVALKVMSGEIRQFPGALEMFRQEAKALAALNHTNIVTVFDQRMADGELFMVMELVEGTTLEQMLERDHTLPPLRAAELVSQLCAGLAYAHGRRVIHRDIKPANVFITHDGTVKLGDFGLARVLNEVQIKQTMVRGTPLYMSPEQIRGTDIDFRADIYSIGCTFFEMVTGRPPFDDGDILYHHMHTPPPRPSSVLPGLPPPLDELIHRCIAKDVTARVPSAEALRNALRGMRDAIA